MMKIYLRVKLSKRRSTRVKNSSKAVALRVKNMDKNWQIMQLKGGLAKVSPKNKPSI